MTLTCGIISVMRGIQKKENAMAEMTIQEMVAQWLKDNLNCEYYTHPACPPERRKVLKERMMNHGG